MSRLVNDFIKRWKEITNFYYGLFKQRREMSEKFISLHKQVKKEEASETIISDMLSGKEIQDSSFKSEIEKLKDELATLDKKIEVIESNGGLTNLYRSDDTLKSFIQPLVDELLAQAKKDEKVRKDLEKRYENVIKEIAKLDEEKQLFEEKYEKVNDLLMKINRVANDVAILQQIRPYYKFKKYHFYNHLGKVRNFR